MPHHFPLDTPDDVAKVLPPPPLGFRPGVALPGISGWVLVRKLGRGGFGEVWLARHTKFASLVGAVKFFPGESGRALVHEAELIDRVRSAGRHDNLVPLINVDLDGPIPWIMFEFVDGVTLAEWVRALDGKPPAERLTLVLKALGQICDGVAFLHAKAKVVHGDLKPANVLVCSTTGAFRITDLGIGAVAQEANDGLTRGGRRPTSIHGAHTPIYSSPEQRKVGHTLDPRDDVHALGVIGYQMLTGKLDASPGTNAGKVLRKAGAPDELAEQLVNSASDDVDDRPKSGRELRDALKAMENPAKLVSVPPPAGFAPRPPATYPTRGEVGVAGVSPSVAEADKPTPTSPLVGEVGTRSVPGGGAVVPLVPLIGAEPKLVVPAAKPVRKAGDPYSLELPGGVKMAFAWCPPGTFQMGSPSTEKDRSSDEQQHEVRLTKGFYAGVHPVTQAEWKAVMNTDPSSFKGANLPVEQVSWDDAQAFCKKILELTGQAVRLPTEAEWEYACRGGTTTPFYWGTELNGTQANIDGNHPYGTTTKGPYLQKTSPVGSYAKKFPHPWGLADVIGNVWEWCEDWYDAGFYARSPKDDPICTDSEQKYRMLRGGGWHYRRANFCRAAYRIRIEPTLRNGSIGFRLLLPG